jgi:hypothetical protein
MRNVLRLKWAALLDALFSLWGRIRQFLYGVKLTWASAASTLIGVSLFLKAAQVQDLFLEVRHDIFSDVRFWMYFYLLVIVAWIIPVYLSARWMLESTGKDSSFHLTWLP